MDEQITISTPEQVAFQYEIAGIGSRFVAAMLDHLILGLTLFLIICAASIIAPTVGFAGLAGGDEDFTALYIILAIMTLIIFLVLWGYFVVFELVWNGQTPGKRASRLRVIRRSGQPAGAGEIMIRNLIRIVDFLPGFYGIGLTTMFIDPEARRLGDFAAGTIVVREGQETSLRDIRLPSAPQSPYLQPQPAYQSSYGPSGQLTTHNSQFITPTRPDPLPGISLREMTHDDYRLIREMLARTQRGELGRDRSQELAMRLAYGVATRMGQNFAEWQARGWEPLVFLESVLNAKEARGE